MTTLPDQKSPAQGNVFGAVRAGYALIESTRLNDWRRFGEEALGLHAESLDDQSIAFRMDHHLRRLIITSGPAEDVAALGWQVENEAAMETILARLRARQITVQEGNESEARLRGVEKFWRFVGPKQQAIELFVTPMTTSAPLRMKTSGFVTGESGMGHFAITSRRPEAMLAFWQQMFDARVSDYIEAHISGLTLDITFIRLNGRHHSLAIAATRGMRMDPIRTRIQHMNLQAATLEDMTAAYQRCRKMGYVIEMGVGQHTNDRELSFYVRSPSGFAIEFGWNPISVEETNWTPVQHQGISTWGHKPQDQTLLDKFGELRRGVQSLARSEFMPRSF